MKATPKARLQLHETRDYSKFLFNEVQRVDDRLDKHIRNLAISMQTWGFLPSKCIHVVNDSGKLRIIDGHNRYAAAKLAGIPLIYQVGEAKERDAMVAINHNTRKWTARDYVNSYAIKGNQHYITLLHYVTAGLPVMVAASLLYGRSAKGGNINNCIAVGKFEVKTTRDCDLLLEVFKNIPDACNEIKSLAYITALTALFHLPDFDPDIFLEKLTRNPLGLVKAANRKQALESIQDIYNHQSRNKIPLAFLAEKHLAECSIIKPKSESA